VIAILVVSSERYSGKSSLVVGLSLELVDRGYSVGYMKPVGSYPMKVDHEKVDEDAYFVAKAIGIDDTRCDVSPYFLTWDTLNRYMRKKPTDAQARVLNCFNRISEGRDIMLVEGGENFVHGRVLGLSAIEIGNLLEARVILLDTFNDELSVDRVLSAKDFFGERFLGVVFNWVPERRLSFTRNLMVRFLESEGITAFGAIPTDRVLRSITVKDLAEGLNGEIICATDRADELVESMMVGAMGQEQALRLFRKQANKVVITGGDRSDIQRGARDADQEPDTDRRPEAGATGAGTGGGAGRPYNPGQLRYRHDGRDGRRGYRPPEGAQPEEDRQSAAVHQGRRRP
jgi:hypothetical protein